MSKSAPKSPGEFQLLQVMVADPALPWQHRAIMLRDLLNNLTPQSEPIVKGVFERLSQQSAEALYQEKTRQLEALLKEMQEGPMRTATFIEFIAGPSAHIANALVVLDDGTEACVIVPAPDHQPPPRLGDRIVLDGKGRVLLRHAAASLKIGEIARFERRIDERHLEVTLRNGAERSIFLATQSLLDQIQAAQITPGASLIVSPRRALALAPVPPENGLAHYRYLDRNPVPDVRVDRDIGAPPSCIDDVTRHVHRELTQPQLRRRYRLRRCCTKLLCGVSGTGKSLAIAAIHRRLYEVMSAVTGLPIEQLPPRVIRIRQDQILSMWLGESEKNWERAMAEALQLADETVAAADGRHLKLPVLVVLEEVDGLGRARGHEAVHDRILTSILQSLDPGRLELSDRLIIVLATTNEPHLVDPALLRRIGGTIEHFHRLKRRSFSAVLDRLTRELPAAPTSDGTDGDDNAGESDESTGHRRIWRQHVDRLAAWFFSPNGADPGLVELTYAGSATPVIKYRRDFLTAALVDRAVQQAAAEAAQAEIDGTGPGGVTFEQLARAFETQLRGIVDQLREHNAGSHTDLPDGARVATLRRIPQPAHLPFAFQRN